MRLQQKPQTSPHDCGFGIGLDLKGLLLLLLLLETGWHDEV